MDGRAWARLHGGLGGSSASQGSPGTWRLPVGGTPRACLLAHGSSCTEEAAGTEAGNPGSMPSSLEGCREMENMLPLGWGRAGTGRC